MLPRKFFRKYSQGDLTAKISALNFLNYMVCTYVCYLIADVP